MRAIPIIHSRKLKTVLDKYRDSPLFGRVSLISPKQANSAGDTPLHIAAIRGEAQDTEIFLEAGADIDCLGDMRFTALHYAAQRGYIDVVRILLAAGASTDAVNEFRETALDAAKSNGHAEVAKLIEAHRRNTE